MAWHPTYYALQINDLDNDTTVIVPSLGIFTDRDKAQGEADSYNRACSRAGKLYYSVVSVQILAVEESAHA